MSDDLVSRLKRLARIARRALETNKCMSIWCADPDTLDAAAQALTEARAEIERLRAGINGIVNCQGPMTRAQVRDACAEILGNKTVGLDNQSPFAEAMLGYKARADAAESELSTLRARTSELASENTNLRNDLVQRGMAEESLRARVREVVGPFSRLDISHTEDIDDSALVFENEGGNIVLGHLRAARQLMEEVK